MTANIITIYNQCSQQTKQRATSAVEITTHTRHVPCI